MPEDNVELTPPVFLTFRDAVVRVDRTFTGSWYLVKEDWLHAEREKGEARDDRVPRSHAEGC
jgi:hypothetical protein